MEAGNWMAKHCLPLPSNYSDSFRQSCNSAFLIEVANIFMYANDNCLASSSKTLSELFSILDENAQIALKWLNDNEMVANPMKFQAICIKKDHSDTGGIEISLNYMKITLETALQLLGIKLDNTLNFDPHISDCEKGLLLN